MYYAGMYWTYILLN